MQQSSKLNNTPSPWSPLKWAMLAVGVVLLGVFLWFEAAPQWAGAPGQGGGADVKPVATRVTFAGRVIDGESRAGVGHAQITLSNGEARYDLKADDAGRFEIKVPVEAGAWEISASAPSYLPADAPWVTQAQAGESFTEIKLPLWAQGRVVGRVVHKGAPVQGASLRVVRLSGDEAAPVDSGVETGEGGRFELTLRPGRLRLLVEAPSLARGESREIALTGGRREDVGDIDLTERGELVVRVLDPQGEGVQGAYVDPVGVVGWGRRRARTDAQGEVSLPRLPVGEVSVRVWAQRFSEALAGPASVEAEAVSELTVTLEPLQGLAGVVVDPEGAPIKGARVALHPEGMPQSVNTQRTRRDGSFRFEGLDQGSYEVSATHLRFGPSAIVSARAGQEEVLALSLSAGGAVEGLVLAPDGGRVTKFTVVVDSFTPAPSPGLREQALGPQHFTPRSQRSTDGAFSIDRLAPGTYTLLVDSPGYGPGKVENIAVESGRVVRGVVVRLTRGAVFRGVVLERDSRRPVEGVHVMVRDMTRRARGLGSLEAYTDDEGRFVIDGVGEGRRSLRLVRDGYVSQIVAGVEARDRDEARREVLLERLPESQRGAVRTEFYGVGATLSPTPQGTATIVGLMNGAPAAEAGLRNGDEILAVDGQDVSELGLGRTVELIRGEEGVEVSLQVRRPGEPYPLNVRIERGRVIYEN